MEYLLLIYSNGDRWAAVDAAERPVISAEYTRFTELLVEKGVLRGGSQLQSPTTATMVRVEGGVRVVTDGPYAETKEQLGGYYLVDVADLDEAIAWAAQIPGAARGLDVVEVRPQMERPTGNFS